MGATITVGKNRFISLGDTIKQGLVFRIFPTMSDQDLQARPRPDLLVPSPFLLVKDVGQSIQKHLVQMRILRNGMLGSHVITL
jgi:hypothetical protein